MQLTSYLELGTLMWMMPLHLQVNHKSDDDVDDDDDDDDDDLFDLIVYIPSTIFQL